MDAELKAAEKALGRFISLWNGFIDKPAHKDFVDENYKAFRSMGDVIVKVIEDMRELKKYDKMLDAAMIGRGKMRGK